MKGLKNSVNLITVIQVSLVHVGRYAATFITVQHTPSPERIVEFGVTERLYTKRIVMDTTRNAGPGFIQKGVPYFIVGGMRRRWWSRRSLTYFVMYS